MWVSEKPKSEHQNSMNKEKQQMKKILTGTMAALLVLFVGMGIGFAGNGKGAGNEKGAGDGTGPIHDILSGTEFTYTGTVVGIVPGQGMEVALEGENVTIYGVGAIWYWEAQEVDRPVAGETITATGYTVDFNGELRDIVMTITVGDAEIVLRDAETGAPLWRGARNR
jgi:hypothetical protein